MWSPLYKKDRIAFENVQRRATILVRACKNLSYPERLRKLGLPTLEYRRQRADMVQVYKILNDIDKVDKAKLFSMATYNRTRGHPLKLFKERPRLNVRANSFSNRVTNTWNQLPEDIVMAPSLNAFKGRSNKHWSSHPYKFTASCYDPGVTCSRVPQPLIYVNNHQFYNSKNHSSSIHCSSNIEFSSWATLPHD